jgi:hypothetical protein
LLFLFLCASLLSGLRTSRSCTQFTSVMDCVLHARVRNSLMWFPADASSFLSVTEKRLQPGGGEGGVKAQERRTLAVQAARGKGKGKGKAASAGPSSKSSPQYCLVRAVYKKKTINTLVCVHLVLISWLHLRSFALTLLLSLFSLLCVLASSTTHTFSLFPLSGASARGGTLPEESQPVDARSHVGYDEEAQEDRRQGETGLSRLMRYYF